MIANGEFGVSVVQQRLRVGGKGAGGYPWQPLAICGKILPCAVRLGCMGKTRDRQSGQSDDGPVRQLPQGEEIDPGCSVGILWIWIEACVPRNHRNPWNS